MENIQNENKQVENKPTGVKTEKVINGVKYQVVVKFSETSNETLKDKLVKLMVRDYENEMHQKRLGNLGEHSGD